MGNPKRNIIDTDDMAAMPCQLIDDEPVRSVTLSIANPVSYSMIDIVYAIKRVVDKRAIYYLVECGSEYFINTGAIASIIQSVPIEFDKDCLEKVLRKYFGNLD